MFSPDFKVQNDINDIRSTKIFLVNRKVSEAYQVANELSNHIDNEVFLLCHIDEPELKHLSIFVEDFSLVSKASFLINFYSYPKDEEHFYISFRRMSSDGFLACQSIYNFIKSIQCKFSYIRVYANQLNIPFYYTDPFPFNAKKLNRRQRAIRSNENICSLRSMIQVILNSSVDRNCYLELISKNNTLGLVEFTKALIEKYEDKGEEFFKTIFHCNPLHVLRFMVKLRMEPVTRRNYEYIPQLVFNLVLMLKGKRPEVVKYVMSLYYLT